MPFDSLIDPTNQAYKKLAIQDKPTFGLNPQTGFSDLPTQPQVQPQVQLQLLSHSHWKT